MGEIVAEHGSQVKRDTAASRAVESIDWILRGDRWYGAEPIAIPEKEQRMPTPTGTRRHPRFETSLRVKLIPSQGEPVSGTMLNVSRGGMVVAIPVALDLSWHHQIEVSDSRGVFRLRGEALRLHLSRRSTSGIDALFKGGFEFVGIDVGAGQRLDELLADLSV